MRARFRRQLTYANVMSSIAVVLALGTGAAYAENTIFSSDIVDGEVQSVDIKNLGVANADLAANSVGTGKVIDNTLTAADIAAGAVGSAEVADQALTGDDIDEETLGKVPESREAQALGGASRDLLDSGAVSNITISCDPQSSTFTSCGLSDDFDLPATSDVLVTLSGGWFGDGVGPDVGAARY